MRGDDGDGGRLCHLQKMRVFKVQLMKILLASDSPRRKHLLSWMGLDCQTVSHRVDETSRQGLTVKDLVGQLAVEKAVSVWQPGRLVIGSDLTVSIGKTVMGKPRDLNQAKAYLKALSGRTHTVYCGVAIAGEEKTLMSVAESQVKMKRYNQEIIDRYVKKFEVLDKGGGYAIQFELPGYGSLVESFKGGITTIIGLPLHYLENLLKEFGVKPRSAWRKRCKIETGYEY